MGRSPTTRARRRAHDDSGFTLVEAVVALFVLGIIFTALAAAAMGSLRASLNSRAEQQAIDFATEALEKARQADYYALGHDAADVSSDTARHPCGTTSVLRSRRRGSEELVMIPARAHQPAHRE